MNIAETSFFEIGNTPLLMLEGVYAKLECTNPCGSIKDRIAKYIIEQSEEQGLLKPGMTIIEATSGNTGISFSYFARKKGYRIIIVMPENMTEERKQIIKNFGGELIECAANDFLGAVAIRDKLAQENGYFNPDQFSNPLNVECHRHTTGQEILRQIKPYAQKIDALVAGVGTGGTLIGIGKALKEKYPNIHIVAVEPSESAVMSGGKPGAHRIGGIGDGFIPSIAQGDNGNIHEIIHEVVCISSDEARQASRELKQKHGYCVGMSSGANFLAAKKLHERFTTVVTVFPDGYYKYQSLGLEASKRHHCQCKKSQSLIC